MLATRVVRHRQRAGLRRLLRRRQREHLLGQQQRPELPCQVPNTLLLLAAVRLQHCRSAATMATTYLANRPRFPRM